MQAVNFHTLVLPSSPNYYLACPQHYCNVKPNQISPTLSKPIAQVELKWQIFITQQPRVSLINSDPAHHQYFYVQRSLIFHFPDYITVKFIPLSAKQTSVAIFSQSKYGYSDLNVNKKRVISWLQALSK